jgi:transcriptional regulator with XRE-family HTH domain
MNMQTGIATRSATPMTMAIGTRIREARVAFGMTQETLGARIGVTFQQLQKYETGKNRVSADRLYFIAQVLGVPITYFYPPDAVMAAPAAKVVQS